MSKGDRILLAEAETIAADFVQFIKDVSCYHVIAGSIRRQKPSIGDIEIVVEPTNRAALWNRLDVMVANGTIKKAVYHDKNDKDSYRWGEIYRGVLFMGMKIEIFSCDADNRGFQTWLRTGSAEKNEYVVTQMKKRNYPVRFSGGYAWHVSYDKAHPMFDTDKGFAKLNKLRVENENVVYQLLGMPFMPSNMREIRNYSAYFDNGMQSPSESKIKSLYAGGQRSMF